MALNRSGSVLFYVDSALDAGLGHVMRCRALADALARAGQASVFLLSAENPAAQDLLSASGHEAAVFGPPADTAPAARSHRAAAWVVDHYGVDAATRAVISPPDIVSAEINDWPAHGPLQNAPHLADVIINPNAGRSISDYDGLLRQAAAKSLAREAGQQIILAGAPYALLDHTVRGLRATASMHHTAVTCAIDITCGAADPTGASVQVLNALPKCGPVQLLVGPTNPMLPVIEQAAVPYGAKITFAREDIWAPRDDAIIITAAGTTLWELLCIGHCAIALIVVDNQEFGAKAAADAGACITIDMRAESGPAELKQAVEHLQNNPAHRAALARAGRALIDGNGAERAAQAIEHAMTQRAGAR